MSRKRRHFTREFKLQVIREIEAGKSLAQAVHDGAVQRVRPKMMTVMAMLMGLLPLIWSTGTGADVMKRIAAPMVGGLITSTILTFVIIPAIYVIWRRRGLRVE